MPQVLVKVTPDAFYYAFNHNARRRDQIRVSPILSEQVTLRCAQEFHRLYPTVRGRPYDRLVHKTRLESFHTKHCHIRLATDMDGGNKLGGFVVLSGELIGLHHVERGHGDWLMQHAVHGYGADRLDCYDIPHLIELYKRHGFREVLREANHTAGQPDVVWMRKE